MREPMTDPVLLLIRGTLVDGDAVDAARKTHNATAGNDAGVAAARSLGDLSHKVYLPAKTAMSGAKPGELLIMDVWETAEGIQQFFSNPQVAQGGGKLFTKRDPTVWMPAREALTFNLPAPVGRTDRFVGILRTRVKTPAIALDVFRTTVARTRNQARQRGQLSHELFFLLGPPSGDGSAEMLGVDVWSDLKGMEQHYQETMEPLSKAFAGAPEASIWTQPHGEWVEW